MPIPNTITRTLDLAHPQEKVWAALTTLDGLTAQLPDAWLESTYQGNVEGWRSELGELVAYLDAAA